MEGPSDLGEWAQNSGDYNEWDVNPILGDICSSLEDSELEIIILDYPFSTLNTQLKDMIDLSIFIDTPLDIALARRLSRDKFISIAEIKSSCHIYLNEGRRAFQVMIEKVKPTADIVINGTMQIEEITDQILAKIQEERKCMMNIRISAKAIIIDGEKVLLTKNQDDQGHFYLFPGGGQEHGETLEQAVMRECVEEIGQQVEVGALLFIREYIGKNHEHASFDYDFHQVEHYFICDLVNKNRANIEPTNPDSYQVGLEWLPLDSLLDYRIYPKELLQHIIKYTQNIKSPVYLGDIN